MKDSDSGYFPSVHFPPLNDRGREGSGRGFTFVELLVVIAIIAILVGLLLPSLGKARGAADSDYCQSNLRQIVIASLNYAQDYQGYWPPSSLNILEFNLNRWHGTRTSITQPFDFSGSVLKPYLRIVAIRSCPEFTPTITSGPMAFEASAGGYGYNDHYLGSSSDIASMQMSMMGPAQWDKYVGNVPAKMNMIRNPAQKIAFADAAMGQRGNQLIEYSFVEPPSSLAYVDPVTGPVFVTNSPSIHFRHQGKANIAWADGHVSSESFQWTYPGLNVYGADNTALQLGYFGPHDNSLFQRN